MTNKINVSKPQDKGRAKTVLYQTIDYDTRNFTAHVNPAADNARGYMNMQGVESESTIEGRQQSIEFPPLRQKVHAIVRNKKAEQQIKQKAQQVKQTRKRKRIPVKKRNDVKQRNLF